MNATGSFSNDNGDGNENVKTTTVHVQHTFLYISLPSLHDYDVKSSHAMFYGGRKFTTTNFFLLFLNLGSVSKNSVPGKFSYI